jgi:Mg/Co/Ni transporter MgtE
MQREFVTVDSLDMLETAFQKLQECNCHTLPVMREDRLIGLLTMDNLGEFMRIQAALKQQNSTGKSTALGKGYSLR